MSTIAIITRPLIYNPMRSRTKAKFSSKMSCFSQKLLQTGEVQRFYSRSFCTNRHPEAKVIKTNSSTTVNNSMAKNIAIIGSSGAIGSAFTELLSTSFPDGQIHTFSRHPPKKMLPNVVEHTVDFKDETSIEESASVSSKDTPLDMVIVATGILHEGKLMPEKSIREMSAENFHHLFEVNTILPALVAKHFLPNLNQESRSIFGVLSARVGSISDNRLGGWYAYRASKAALNMIIKSAAIEIGRSNKQAVVVGLHPGTVDSGLSKPFQGSVAKDKLFTPEFSAQKLLGVLENLTPEQSGKCFAWDGLEIEP